MERQSAFCPRKFAVVGAGPVGCVLAAFLSRGGYEVTLCDVMSELVGPAAKPGIVIVGAENTMQPIAKTCSTVDALADDPPDVIFLTVKAHAIPLIASAIEGFYREAMYVVSWQNGIDTEFVIAETLGKKPVLRAVVNYGCSLVKPASARPLSSSPPIISRS
jgi:2-dehydropantoate 2-reductase